MALLKKEELLMATDENIPAELKLLPQFVLWKAIFNEQRKKFDKIPYQLNGSRASSTDPETWGTFDSIYKEYEDSVKYDGIGFVITKQDPYVVVDVDNLESVHELDDLAAEVVNMSYAEISPSGAGLHIWFRHDLDKSRHKNKNDKTGYEIYADSRFLTVTGENLNSLPINNGGEKLDKFLDKVLKREQAQVSNVQQSDNFGRAALPEDEIIKIACNNSKMGDRFKSFLYGGWEEQYNNDASSADLAFLNSLAFFCNCDVQIMDSIYRKSDLMRDKWDRPQNGTTYGNEQIMKAVSECANTFTLDKKSNPNDLELNDRGVVIPNARNAQKILTSSPFKGVLAFDAFKGTEVIKGNLPWRKRDKPDKEYELWLGSDDKRLLHYFGIKHDFNSAKIIENAYLDVVRRNSFHPVKDYLEAQSWDGIRRAETLFIDYLGADDTPYIRAVTRKWLAAAVTRIYEPGSKFDYMPVLIGPQGAGKSTIIAKLAKDWFSDSLKNLDGKEASEHLQSSWIFEIGELVCSAK